MCVLLCLLQLGNIGDAMSPADVWSTFVQALLALGHLHKHGMVMRGNVTMENVLSVNGVCKLINFDGSLKIYIIDNKDRAFREDSWGLGCFMLQVCHVI
jgi:hypothetical protein